MDIWYLGHSGFAVDTGKHFLIFDYYLETPAGGGLSEGIIDPEALSGREVLVFSSHHHGDHFNRHILDWRDKIPGVRYLLSDDIGASGEGIMKLGPGQTASLEDVAIRTLKSTDEGVAFLVKADGFTIYHAGDLNWWHWEGEPGWDNEAMGRQYREQIDQLKGEKIDVAFLPLDPRQEDFALLGMDYFMREIGAGLAVPMHFWERYTVFAQLQSPKAAPWREKVAILTHRGQKLVYPA